MTELELFDRLNPKRDLPQATCDVISQVYKVMQNEVTLYEKQRLEYAEKLDKAKEIIAEWEDSYCCGADYLFLSKSGKELRRKSREFLMETQ